MTQFFLYPKSFPMEKKKPEGPTQRTPQEQKHQGSLYIKTAWFEIAMPQKSFHWILVFVGIFLTGILIFCFCTDIGQSMLIHWLDMTYKNQSQGG